jgi:hypothetical protein
MMPRKITPDLAGEGSFGKEGAPIFRLHGYRTAREPRAASRKPKRFLKKKRLRKAKRGPEPGRPMKLQPRAYEVPRSPLVRL